MTRPPRAPATCDAPGCDAETLTRYCATHGVGYGGAGRAAHYQRRWRQGPRAIVLARDPVCTECWAELSSVADHHPTERRDLVLMGVPDPDDPGYLRGVCRGCHNRKSGQSRPRR